NYPAVGRSEPPSAPGTENAVSARDSRARGEMVRPSGLSNSLTKLQITWTSRGENPWRRTQTEEREMMSMRRLTLLAVAGLALSGGGRATRDRWADWKGHRTHFASGEHGLFSLRNDQEGRHPRVSRLDIDSSRSQNWWGKTISVDTAQV